MLRKSLLALAVVAACGSAAVAQEQLNIAGARYPTAIEFQVNNRMVKQVLTGVALRRKLIFNVYTIGSYIDAGVRVRSAQELAAIDAVKQLHLVMQRDVSGASLASAFEAAVRMNYTTPAFAAELSMLKSKLQAVTVIPKGRHIRLTNIPGAGIHLNLGGKNQILIKNTAFSKAVWEIYLGRRNLGNTIKTGLVSRIR